MSELGGLILEDLVNVLFGHVIDGVASSIASLLGAAIAVAGSTAALTSRPPTARRSAARR